MDHTNPEGTPAPFVLPGWDGVVHRKRSRGRTALAITLGVASAATAVCAVGVAV
ncbi:hypothetical protein PYV02_01485 [Leifsonia sp. H3M29-4]|uniref:hypothetical protein n=1 Tax=Salinibacterium metalliresistens TaxID=3031321 RepID=UPI0023DCBC8E|nr:hypothetical protein [Salinibacterium metalliresistens]MDF1477751.1 hypothetical protein [Salinibacterium metalliresistens]